MDTEFSIAILIHENILELLDLIPICPWTLQLFQFMNIQFKSVDVIGCRCITIEGNILDYRLPVFHHCILLGFIHVPTLQWVTWMIATFGSTYIYFDPLGSVQRVYRTNTQQQHILAFTSSNFFHGVNWSWWTWNVVLYKLWVWWWHRISFPFLQKKQDIQKILANYQCRP